MPSFAKINWTLRVLGRRTDGFHELCTVFQTVTLSDSLSFAPCDGLLLECDDPTIPTDRSNLIIKAAEMLQAESGVSAGASLRLDKRVPSPGGLGGGSSNAAMALLGLSELWGLNPGPGDLFKMAARLGADVPFFLVGGTALGTGRGDDLEAIGEVDEPLMAIVTPRFGVLTAEAFAGLSAETLTTSTVERNLMVCRRDAEHLLIRQESIVNDLEGPVFRRNPEIAQIKRLLIGNGARVAQMSGSGSSLFAVFDKEETRQATLEALNELNWRMFAVATLSRSRYREALNPCQRLLPISF